MYILYIIFYKLYLIKMKLLLWLIFILWLFITNYSFAFLNWDINNITKTNINTSIENELQNYINKMKVWLPKKVWKILIDKRLSFINKYWEKNWEKKFKQYLYKINKALLKVSKIKKYEKYNHIFNDIIMVISNILDILNSTNTNIQKENHINYINMPTVKLEKGILNKFKLEQIFNQEIKDINTETFDQRWGQIEQHYPDYIKQFINYLNKIDNLDKKQTWLYLNINTNTNNNKYQINNHQLNFKLPPINKKALEQAIQILSSSMVMDPITFNKLVMESNKAKINLLRIKQTILNELTNKLINLKNLKPSVDEYNWHYFGNKLKIAVHYTFWWCWSQWWSFPYDNHWLNELKEQASNYNWWYYTFYYKFSNWFSSPTYQLILYKKNKYCFNKLNNWFNILLNNTNIDKKKIILWKLWAKYLLSYNDWYQLINNNYYHLLYNNKYNNNNNIPDYFLMNNKEITYSSQSYPYFKISDLNKYYKQILVVSDGKYWKWIYNAYRGKEYYLYIWNKLLFPKFYYFQQMLKLLSNKRFIPSNISNKYDDLINILPKVIKSEQKWYADILKKIYLIIDKNNFNTLEDIYKYIIRNYNYEKELAKESIDDYNNKIMDKIDKKFKLEYILNTHKGICIHFAMLLSTLASIYQIPSGVIYIDFYKSWEWHAVSLLNWNIYDPTRDIWKFTENGMKWTTFMVTDRNLFNRIKKITIFYPKKGIKDINKTNKLYSLPISYNKY